MSSHSYSQLINKIDALIRLEPDNFSFMRHFIYCKRILGESTTDAEHMARMSENKIELTKPKMIHTAIHWNHEPECPTCIYEPHSHGE